MKHLLICLTCIFYLSNISAQQAIWESKEILSPVIHEDNRVTFSLRAPDATNVQLTGDFLTSPVSLVKDREGIWSYTSEILPSELYSYSFILDGVKITDPANVYSVRDVTSVMSLFLIDGGVADLYKVTDVPHGTVIKQWYNSPTLNKERRMTIYTPAGYDANKEKYPVLYLLHGMGGDEQAWSDLGRAIEILDNMIASGKVKPMIVVMPNGNVSQSAAPGYSSNGFKRPIFMLPHTMDGLMESSFPDIVDYIDAHYRTIPTKEGRAIAGLSMGGFHSLHISKEYPDMFNYIGLFSAAIMPDVIPEGDVNAPIYANMDAKLKKQNQQKPALYWIAIGTDDFLYKSNVEYRKKLDELNIDYVYYESGEGHIWKNWRIYLSMFLPKIF